MLYHISYINIYSYQVIIYKRKEISYKFIILLFQFGTNLIRHDIVIDIADLYCDCVSICVGLLYWASQCIHSMSVTQTHLDI